MRGMVISRGEAGGFFHPTSAIIPEYQCAILSYVNTRPK